MPIARARCGERDFVYRFWVYSCIFSVNFAYLQSITIKYMPIMKKIRAAVVGYGNIGKYVIEALEAAADFEVAGVVRRASSVAAAGESKYPVVSSLEQLEGVDVAILCTPSRLVEQSAEAALKLGISTVDSFDIHTGIADMRARLDVIARENNAAALISAVGIRVATLWYAPCWRCVRRRVSHTPTSVPV